MFGAAVGSQEKVLRGLSLCARARHIVGYVEPRSIPEASMDTTAMLLACRVCPLAFCIARPLGLTLCEL